VPEKDALPQDKVEKAVVSALSEAAARGIRGKAVTPFLLERVAELSGGESRRANISLLVNNARVAGRIASALERMAGQ
jgi:pseudouridine-5'-phosphate glycosidase